MKNCSDIKDVKSIQNIYPNIHVGFYQVPLLGTVNVFTLLFENVSVLKENWKDIYSSIAAYFQAGLPVESEFERWNIYLFYICREEVEKELQYKIENDRFASRKIVLGNCKEEITDEVVERVINQHITNTDLEIGDMIQQGGKGFLKNVIISEIVDLNKPKTQKKGSEIDIQKILDELENKFRDEI